MAFGQQFDAGRQFSEGLAEIAIDHKWGFIDLTGKTVIEPRFDLVMRFTNGVAYASVGPTSGYIDRRGNWVWKTGDGAVEPETAKQYLERAQAIRLAGDTHALGSRVDFPKAAPTDTELPEQKKVKATITYCTPDISQRWQLANLTFNSRYSFRVNEKGEVIEVRKVRDDFIGEEAVKACLATWKILGASPKAPFVVSFNWKRGQGWAEQRVSGDGFTEVRER